MMSKLKYILCIFIACVTFANPLQSKNPNPVNRKIIIKLPLQHARFHWMFTDEKSLMNSTLTLFINKKAFPIIKNHKLDSHWLDLKVKAGQYLGIYYEFHSKNKIATKPSDQLRLVWKVLQKIEGVGACHQGFIVKGIYTAKSKFSLLTDNPDVTNTLYYQIIQTSNYSDTQKQRMIQQLAYQATAEDFLPLFSIAISKKHGWLPAAQYKKFCGKIKPTI